MLSDEESRALYDYYVPGRLKEYDLILACGDLKPEYLSFIVTMARAPVLYVHGNHDAQYETNPPEGCDCIEDKVVVFKGLRILGLGGCYRYRPGKHQYSETEMHRRIAKAKRKIKKLNGIDIVISHAPPRGVGDADDNAHRGFASFLELMDEYHPRYWIHGHVHMTYGIDIVRELEYNGTKVINAFEKYVLEIPDDSILPTNKKGDVDFGYY
jgi:Icc-related predicted phosphoesterase